MSRDLFLKIKHLSDISSGKQKQVSKYLLSHLEELPFQPLSNLSKRAGVSESTIIRFARALGCAGYPDLQMQFQKIILKKLSPTERLGKYLDSNTTLRGFVEKLFKKEIHNIMAVQENIDIKNLESIANTIFEAERKYILGLRASSGCAYLLGHLLGQVLPDVFTITDGDTRLFESLKAVGSKDVVVGISYPRYTRNTVEALHLAKNRGAKTVAITDSEFSPAAQIAGLYLLAPADSLFFENSYTACGVVINVVVSLIARIDKALTRKMLKEWEESTKGLDFVYKQ